MGSDVHRHSELEHVVNGDRYTLTPGMLGYVKPPDLVNQRIAPNGSLARALVIWAPGGEAARIGLDSGQLRRTHAF